MKAEDSAGNVAYAGQRISVVDQGAPVIDIKQAGSELTIEISDESDISEARHSLFLADDPDCESLTYAAGQDGWVSQSGSRKTISIAISRTHAGHYLCVKAEDEHGQTSYEKHEVRNAPTLKVLRRETERVKVTSVSWGWLTRQQIADGQMGTQKSDDRCFTSDLRIAYGDAPAGSEAKKFQDLCYSLDGGVKIIPHFYKDGTASYPVIEVAHCEVLGFSGYPDDGSGCSTDGIKVVIPDDQKSKCQSDLDYEYPKSYGFAIHKCAKKNYKVSDGERMVPGITFEIEAGGDTVAIPYYF